MINRLFHKHERHWTEAERDLYEQVENTEAELRRRIFDMKATTFAGIAAKAGVVDRFFAKVWGDPDTLADPNDWPAASLVNDILALAEGAA